MLAGLANYRDRVPEFTLLRLLRVFRVIRVQYKSPRVRERLQNSLASQVEDRFGVELVAWHGSLS